MSAHDMTLEAVALRKGFPRIRVLDGVDVLAAPGTLTVVRGGPGSGRTTLARLLTGVCRPDAGRVLLRTDDGDLALQDADARTLAWVRAHHLGLATGELVAAPCDTAAQTAARVLERRGVPEPVAGRLAGDLLEALGLEEDAGTAVGLLPARARRALAVGRVLLQPPPVLVLDEPVLGIEPAARAAIAGRVGAVRDRGVAVLATAARTGDEDLTELADRLLDIDQGELT